MNTVFKIDDNRCCWLTTDSPASSYGLPVLRISTKDGYEDYGPGDMVIINGVVVSCGYLVQCFTEYEGLSHEDKTAMAKFLSQHLTMKERQ